MRCASWDRRISAISSHSSGRYAPLVLLDCQLQDHLCKNLDNHLASASLSRNVSGIIPFSAAIQKVRQEQGQRQGKEQKQEQVRSSSECSQSKFGTLPHLFPMISIGEGSNQTPEVKHEKGTKLRPGTLYVYI